MSLRAQFSWPGRRPKAGRKTIGCLNRYSYELFSGNLLFIIERRWAVYLWCGSLDKCLMKFVQIWTGSAHSSGVCFLHSCWMSLTRRKVRLCQGEQGAKSGTWHGRREVYGPADRRHASRSHLTGWWKNLLSTNVKQGKMDEREERLEGGEETLKTFSYVWNSIVL